MKKLLLLISILSFTFNTDAQTLADLLQKNTSGHKITGTITGLQDSTIMLAYYFGGKQYATDTAVVTNGKFTFEGEKELKGGMYLVVLSESRYFDIIVSEQHFSFTTKTDDLVGAMTFKNSKENPVFYKYLNFITDMQKEVTPLRKQLETAEGENKKALQDKASEVDKKVKEFQI